MEKKQHYRFMWGQKQSAMITDAMLTEVLVAVDISGNEIPSSATETVFLLTDGIFEHFMPERSIRGLEHDSERYRKKAYAAMLVKSIEEHIHAVFSFSNDIYHQDLGVLSNNILASVLRTYHEHMKRTFLFFATSTPTGTAFVEKKLRSILKEIFRSEKTVEEYFIALSSPAAFDETMNERRDFARLLQKKSVAREELQRYARKYPALFFNTYNENEIFDFLRARLREKKTRKEMLTEIAWMDKNVESIRRRHETIYRAAKHKELEYYADILQRSALGRYRLKHCWSGVEYLCLNLIQEFRKRVGLPMDDFLSAYLFEDIYRFLEKGRSLSAPEIKARRTSMLIHYFDGSRHTFSGEEALRYRDRLLGMRKEQKIHGREFRGTIANSGVVRGKARIINVRDLKQFSLDCAAFQKGEILVTTMTSPVMVPIIEKSAGIVTDEGGICSHAAVISREFHIPCIVGTHGASSVIQTGDMIEVDADHGTVRIL